nr:immunoglobulin heavy chain junction region [Macaca mulatta]MOV54437.1 immunoglobulin heavy chain junction region [Macaca mulatta]MOV54503.1 immunoglobulin heavy chain junction region [Macaca mulatta]MOV55252.1 immunoglobulin heavy chain junction region [Macaca mulatta]MOV55406.1 immunoglobulin heavy chain junction region [Macaca mulatta]
CSTLGWNKDRFDVW